MLIRIATWTLKKKTKKTTLDLKILGSLAQLSVSAKFLHVLISSQELRTVEGEAQILSGINPF